MARETTADRKTRGKKILNLLKKTYPNAECALHHESPFQLLIATILSAQCTDARVNITTPALFKRFPTPKDFAEAKIGEVETLIRSTGFYKNKAKNIVGCSKTLLEKYDGEVPKTMDQLSDLPGVGRKTANVVLGNVYDVPAMVVDTHVTRLSNRMGLGTGQDAVKLEFQLMDVIDKKDWTISSHLLISHGRAICSARSPKCDQCTLEKICPKKL